MILFLHSFTTCVYPKTSKITTSSWWMLPWQQGLLPWWPFEFCWTMMCQRRTSHSAHCSWLSLVSTCRRTGYTAHGCPDIQFYGAHTLRHMHTCHSSRLHTDIPLSPSNKQKDPKVFFEKHHFICKQFWLHYFIRAQELCESWGGSPGLPFSLIVRMVSVDVKQH